jgi:hypothetical protein
LFSLSPVVSNRTRWITVGGIAVGSIAPISIMAARSSAMSVEDAIIVGRLALLFFDGAIAMIGWISLEWRLSQNVNTSWGPPGLVIVTLAGRHVERSCQQSPTDQSVQQSGPQGSERAQHADQPRLRSLGLEGPTMY